MSGRPGRFSNDVGKRSSQWKDKSPEEKRKCSIQRKANRANQSEEAKEERRRRDREKKKHDRANLSPSALLKVREVQKIKKRNSRAKRSPEQLLHDREKDRKRQASKRLEREIDGLALEVMAQDALDIAPCSALGEISMHTDPVLLPSVSTRDFFTRIERKEEHHAQERARPQECDLVLSGNANATETHMQLDSAGTISPGRSIFTASTVPEEFQLDIEIVEKCEIDYKALNEVWKSYNEPQKGNQDNKNAAMADIEGICVQPVLETPIHGLADVDGSSNSGDNVVDFDLDTTLLGSPIMSAEQFTHYLEVEEPQPGLFL